jgi:hypothetical protein
MKRIANSRICSQAKPEVEVSVAEFSRLRARRAKVVPARLGYAAWRAITTLVR